MLKEWINRSKKELVNRIGFLERLVVKANDYIKKLEEKYRECRNDRNTLLEQYESLVDELRKVKKEVEWLERQNKELDRKYNAAIYLLKDMVNELNRCESALRRRDYTSAIELINESMEVHEKFVEDIEGKEADATELCEERSKVMNEMEEVVEEVKQSIDVKA